jgi:hypothetical protein
VEFSASELSGFQGFFPDSPGAMLVNRLMVGNAQEYENVLHDPASSLEQLRFAQGALEGLGKLGLLMKEFIAFDGVGRGDEGGVREEAETQVEMDF